MTKWEEYEMLKKQIVIKTSEEYEQKIREILKQLGL